MGIGHSTIPVAYKPWAPQHCQTEKDNIQDISAGADINYKLNVCACIHVVNPIVVFY